MPTRNSLLTSATKSVDLFLPWIGFLPYITTINKTTADLFLRVVDFAEPFFPIQRLRIRVTYVQYCLCTKCWLY